MPTAQIPRVFRFEGFRESSEGQKVVPDFRWHAFGKSGSDFRIVGFLEQFGYRQRMETVVVIPSQERVASFLIQIQSRAARDQDGKILLSRVENALDVVFPIPVFVELVEDDELRSSPKRFGKHGFAVVTAVPIQVRGVFEGFPDASGQRGLANLTGSADENHFFREVCPDIGVEVSFHGEIMENNPDYYSRV
jgi:hypothetical protein